MNFFREINRRKLVYRLKVISLLFIWFGVFTYIVCDCFSLDKEYESLAAELNNLESDLDNTVLFTEEDIEKEKLLMEDYWKYSVMLGRQLNVNETNHMSSRNLTVIKQCFPTGASLNVIDIDGTELTLEGYVLSMEIIVVILQNLENTGLFTDVVETFTQSLTGDSESESYQTEEIYFRIVCGFIED